MPLPKPKTDESHDDWIDRCMANPTMRKEYPDDDQRHAVCQSIWEDRGEPTVEAGESPTLERRVLPAAGIEIRVVDGENGKAKRIEGYAAVFNRDSADLGGFIERIKPGAFTNALSDSDVRALVNHDSNLLLGRSSAGTLRLVETKRGLKFSIDLPDTQAARDTATSVKRGDMDGSSFAFTVQEDAWSTRDGKDLREIVEIKRLFDVGPVTYPAYPDTTVAARSLDAWRASRATPTIGTWDEAEVTEPVAEEPGGVEPPTPAEPAPRNVDVAQARMDEYMAAEKARDREMLDRDIARKMRTE